MRLVRGQSKKAFQSWPANIVSLVLGNSKQVRWFIAFVLLAAVGFSVAFATRTRRFSHELPDGSVLKLQSVSYGKTLRFETRRLWEHALFKFLGTNLPTVYWPSGQSFTSFYPSGSVGLTFTRSFNQGRDGSWPELSLILEDGRELFCDRRVSPSPVTFGKTRSVRIASQKKFGSKDNKLADELILWEVPPSNQKKLHLRLYETRQQTTFVDFWIPNPLPVLAPAK